MGPLPGKLNRNHCFKFISRRPEPHAQNSCRYTPARYNTIPLKIILIAEMTAIQSRLDCFDASPRRIRTMEVTRLNSGGTIKIGASAQAQRKWCRSNRAGNRERFPAKKFRKRCLPNRRVDSRPVSVPQRGHTTAPFTSLAHVGQRIFALTKGLPELFAGSAGSSVSRSSRHRPSTRSREQGPAAQR